MEHKEQWIWLPKERYPKCQKTVFSVFYWKDTDNYTVAEFRKEYSFPVEVVRADLRFSGMPCFSCI